MFRSELLLTFLTPRGFQKPKAHTPMKHRQLPGKDTRGQIRHTQSRCTLLGEQSTECKDNLVFTRTSSSHPRCSHLVTREDVCVQETACAHGAENGPHSPGVNYCLSINFRV